MRVSLTVGKVDAGVAVLLTEDKRLIEFPSILLPSDITSGSIVDVNVSRNHNAESQATKSFRSLQSQILTAFGSESPSAPVLRCRNATQTSVVLEWDPIHLATADLRSLSLFRNGSKAGSIPRPLEMTSTKISGLAIDTEYSFYLTLRTSAGTYSSEKLVVKTHKMTDLSGITVTPGLMPPQLRESLASTVDRMGAKIIDSVRIDTTHFVCTEGRGAQWEKAVEMNVPVVVPDWVYGCEREGRLVGVTGYYLNADPKLRQVGPGSVLSRAESQVTIEQQRSEHDRQESQTSLRQQETPRTEITPPTPEQVRKTQAASRDEEDEEESDDEQDEPPPPPTPPMKNESPMRDPTTQTEEVVSEEDDQEDDTGSVIKNSPPDRDQESSEVASVSDEGDMSTAAPIDLPDGPKKRAEEGVEDSKFDEVDL